MTTPTTCFPHHRVQTGVVYDATIAQIEAIYPEQVLIGNQAQKLAAAGAL